MYYNNQQNFPYYGYGNIQPQPMRTNKIFVTSLEDALNRYADNNTIMVYRHQDENLEYEITTDSYGKKTYKTFKLSDFVAPNNDKQSATKNISRDEFDSFNKRLTALESMLKNGEDKK